MALSSTFAFSNSNSYQTLHHHIHFNQLPSLKLSNTPSFPRKTLSSSICFTALGTLPNSVPIPEGTTFDDDPPKPEIRGGDGGYGGESDGGGGDSGGEAGGNDGDGDEEFGPLLNFGAVLKEAESRGVPLPSDMVEAAKTTGIREIFLQRYMDLQGSAWPLSFLMKNCSIMRNRMLADPSFLFKVGTEVLIDTCCATFAKYKHRGKDFWAELELVAADVLLGCVVDIALVTLLAPYARVGKLSEAKGLFGRIQHACAALPSSVFEAQRPGCKFTVMQRIATYFYKGALYGSVGFGCGIIGQGFANMLMNAKRSIRKSEEDIPVPPLLPSFALWGFFQAVSSNTQYQTINGMERLVESSPLAKKARAVAMAFMIGVRFGNNIYGGIRKSGEDIPVPPLLPSTALYGFFHAVSSNTRYQIINGMEQLVESSPLAKKARVVTMAFTIGVRFGNIVYGRMQFVDWAKRNGIQ